jgi:hypothetical protein
VRRRHYILAGSLEAANRRAWHTADGLAGEGNMKRLWLPGAVLLAAAVAQVTAGAAQDKPYGIRGTLVAVDDQLLTLANDDEETFEVALTEDTGAFAVTPAEWGDIKPGQFVGITSVESGAQRVALEVHIFAEDLRGTGEGHYPWDLIEQPNMMTNANVAEVKDVSPAERELRLTYKEGEGADAAQGEQVITVPDFVEVVHLAKSEDAGLSVPGRVVFALVRDSQQGPPAAVAVAVGVDGAIPPM